jgi:hypothetical protein
MQFRHLLAVCAKEEDEGDGRGEGGDATFSAFEELFPGKGFVAVFLDALEDGFDAGRVLEEFCVLFLAGLEGGDGVVCSELSTHFGEDYRRLRRVKGGGYVHVSVVFILPTLTRRETMATLTASSLSERSFSRTTREHLLLRDMDSMYKSANVIFAYAESYEDVKTAWSLLKMYDKSANWMSLRYKGTPSGFLI